MKIGVFDSGMGGKTVLAAIQEKLPEEEYIYVGDSKNCPYGEKTLEELQRIVSGIAEGLIREGAKIIVVACNTATTQTIGFLRETFPSVPFVGTEPAIKKACDESSEKAKIVLLATEGTARAPRTFQLIKNNKKPKQKVKVIPCPGLAKAIEKSLSKGEKSSGMSELSSALKILEKQGSDEVEAVVLGCTHYPLIREQIQRFFPKARLIDGGEGVAKEVERIVRETRQKETKSEER
ncbi:glutamate racemase [Candidatus Saccharibacteria bacterium]|nr:glutamate racemase [Candidatus Saccharibacteria bacterium]